MIEDYLVGAGRIRQELGDPERVVARAERAIKGAPIAAVGEGSLANGQVNTPMEGFSNDLSEAGMRSLTSLLRG